MNDEYNNFGHELNKAIPEFKEIKAIEYYAPKEAVNPPSEVVRIPEASQDTYGMDRQPLTAEREHRSFEDKLDDRFRNTADGQQSPDMNAGNVQGDVSTTGSEAAGDAGASASTSGGASTSGASGTSASGGTSVGSASATAGASTAGATTAASMAGSVTVVACATVGVVALAGGTITAPEPNIVSAVYDVGTNYIKYEIDVEDLAPGINYKIKIYNNTFYEEYPITEPGVQKQIVTGLTPFRPYNIEIVGSSESIIETKFLTDTVVTSQLPQPQAVFDFTPVFDYTNLTYDINYDIYISDHYKTGSNHRIEITAGGEPVEDVPEMVDEDNFFRGVIRGLVNLDVVEAIAYTTYCDEEIVIGEYNYSAKYPDDFIADNEKYEATYSLQQPSIEYSDLGFNLSINTGFTSTDPRDGYIIDVYESEVSNNAETEGVASSTSTRTPIASYTFNKYDNPDDDGSIATLLVPGNVNGIDVYYTGTKTTNKTLKKYESKKIYSYQMEEARSDAPIYTSLDFKEDFDSLVDKYKLTYDLEVNDVFNKCSEFEVIERINDRVVNDFILGSKTYGGVFETTANGSTVYVDVYGKPKNSNEFELIKTYEHEITHQEPFKNIEFAMLESGCYIELEYYKEDSSKEFSINITQNNIDGTKKVLNDTFVGMYSNEFGYSNDGSITLKDIKSFDVSISSGETLVREFTVLPMQATLTCGEIDVDGDGNVAVPFEVTIPDNTTLDYAYLNFVGANDSLESTELSGTFTLKNLNANIITPTAEVVYVENGVSVRSSVTSNEINIGADYEVSYYASHYNSFYTTVNIRFDATLNGKTINMDLKPEVLEYTGDGNEYVSIDDRHLSSQEYRMYNGYYVVDAISDSDNPSSYKLTYKITAPGFTDTNAEHEVVVNSNFMAGTPSAGRVVNRGAWVDYVKTTNQDGTVNYYFDTQLVSNDVYFGRLEYSYTVDGKEEYLYTEISDASTISLTNLVDRDYNFKYSVYRLNDGIYYDTEPFSGIYSYTCVEVQASDALNSNTASIVSQTEGRTTVKDISFELYSNNVDTENPIVVEYGDKSYTIPIESKTSTDFEIMVIDDDSYSYGWQSQDGYEKYIVVVNSSNNTINVEIAITNSTGGEIATVTFNGCPNNFISSYLTDNDNVNDIINYESLSKEVTMTIGEYKGEFDVSKFTSDVTAGSSSYGNTVRIEVNGFNSTDSRDTLKAIALVDGNEVASDYLRYGEYFDLVVSPAYTNFDVKIVEVKSQSVTSLLGYEFSNTELEYEEYEFDTFTFDAQEIITNLSVSEDGEMFVRVEPVDSDGFGDFYVKVEQFYKMSASASETSVTHTGEAGETEVSFDKQYQTTKLIVDIYNKPSWGDDLLVNRFEIAIDATIGDYIYNDNDDYITLPCSLILPDGAVLDTSNSSVFYGMQDPQFFEEDGTNNIRIESLESNIVNLSFSVNYTLNGTSVSYSFEKKHEIESEVNLDYAIYTVFGNSSYGGFSCNSDSVRYDETNDIVYILNSEDGNYYDKDGNLAPETGTDSKWLYNTMYYLSGKLVTDIGCFTNLPYESTYTLTVHTAGENIIDTSTGNLKDESDLQSIRPDNNSAYTEQSADISGIYITFKHTTIDYKYVDYDVHGINTCELSFDIFKDGEAIITKNIVFNEVSPDTIPESNSFSLDRSAINSSATKNADDTINLTINTGFDSTTNPNYAYKVELHEKLSYNGYTHEKLYESDYSTSSLVSFSNVKNTNYEVYVTVYNVQDGNYIKYESYNIGRANSPIEDTDWKYDSNAGTYSNYLYIDTNYINPDYLDGSKLLSFKTGTIDLSSTASQSVSSNTVLVEDQGSGIYKITITASNYNDPRGNIVIEQGNEEIGYTEVTYSI